MLSVLVESLRSRLWSTGLCFLVLAGIGGGLGLFLSAGEALAGRGEEELGRQRALAYDILVRPAGSRSAIEQEYGLLEPNHLTALPGGISFDEYEAIRDLPGVEVAAPIANLGIYRQPLYVWLGDTLEPGLYAVSCRTVTSWAGRTSNREDVSYRYVGADATQLTREDAERYQVSAGLIRPACYYSLAVSLAGVSPEAEAALTGLDATVTGAWLHSSMAVPSTAYQMSSGQKVLATIPTVIRASQAISVTFSSTLIPLEWPEGAAGIRDVMDLGGPETLTPLEPLARVVLEGPATHQTLLSGLVARGGRRFNIPQFSRLAAPSAVTYRKAEPPGGSGLPTFEAVPVGVRGVGAAALPTFRVVESTPLDVGFYYAVAGTYEPAFLPGSGDPLLPPSLLWAVPTATLTLDPEGHERTPLPLTESATADGYLLAPPTFLTTLQAARLLGGDEAIGAIRVRVEGIKSLTPAALRRIRTVADDIAARTGLDVDVMAGSGRQPVLVYLPGVEAPDGAVRAEPLGYAGETWLRRDAGTVVLETVARSAARLRPLPVLLFALLVAGCLPSLLIGRRADYALLSAVGWRRSTIVGHALAESLVVALPAGFVGIGLATAGASRYALGRISADSWLAVPLVASTVAVGAVAAALVATRPQRGAPSPVRLLWLRGWFGWAPSLNALLTVGLAGLGTFLVVAAQGALADLPARLHGTPFGDWLAVALRGPRDVVVASALVASFIALAGSLLGDAVGRRQRLGMLLALGWRRRQLLLRAAAEGMVLTLIGGLGGAALGGWYASQRFGTDRPAILWTAIITLVILLAGAFLPGAYAAWLAARADPADAVKPR